MGEFFAAYLGARMGSSHGYGRPARQVWLCGLAGAFFGGALLAYCTADHGGGMAILLILIGFGCLFFRGMLLDWEHDTPYDQRLPPGFRPMKRRDPHF